MFLPITGHDDVRVKYSRTERPTVHNQSMKSEDLNQNTNNNIYLILVLNTLVVTYLVEEVHAYKQLLFYTSIRSVYQYENKEIRKMPEVLGYIYKDSLSIY